MPAPTSITNNNQNQPITVGGAYCFIQVPGWIPPAMSPGGMAQAQFGTLTYSIIAGSSGGGTVVTFQSMMADGVIRSLVTPAPITLASSQTYSGTIPFPVGGCQILVSSLTGNGIAQATLTGLNAPAYQVNQAGTYVAPVAPPPVTPPPASNPPPNVPAAASAAGLNTLVFSDDFNTPLDVGFGTTGHKWTAGEWYEAASLYTPNPFSVANSILTITADATNWRELCTQWHNFQGGTFFSGTYYAEAMMMCTDFSAFWFYPAQAPYTPVTASPSTWRGEIDVVETDQSTSGFANKMTSTVHSNTGGTGGAWGGINFFTMPASGTPFGQWHTYAMLLNPGTNTCTFYCDNVLMGSTSTGTSNYLPMTLLLQASPGNVNQGKSGATAVLPPTTQVDWVRVWMAALPPIIWLPAQCVGSNTYANGAVTVICDVNTTTGNTLVVFSGRPGGAVSNITISSGSATFVKLASVLSSGGYSNEIWYATNIVGGTTPHISVFMPHGGDVMIYEYNPGGPTPVPDGSNSASGTGTTATVSMTTTAANDLVLKIVELDGGYNYQTQGAGWVESNTPMNNAVGYQVLASAGAITATATQNSATANWTALIAALKI